jgi:hypothetical protein
MLLHSLCQCTSAFARKVLRVPNTLLPVPPSKPSNLHHFKIRLNKILDHGYFMQIIWNKHPLSETNRMLTAIASGSTVITKDNFESIFRKYCYYIGQIPLNATFRDESINEKLIFLEKVTEVYQKFGRFKSS